MILKDDYFWQQWIINCYILDPAKNTGKPQWIWCSLNRVVCIRMNRFIIYPLFSGFRKASIYVIIPYHLKKPNLEKYCSSSCISSTDPLNLTPIFGMRNATGHHIDELSPLFPPRFHHSDPFGPRLACSGSFKVFNCTREPASIVNRSHQWHQKPFTPTHGSTNLAVITTVWARFCCFRCMIFDVQGKKRCFF